MAVNSSSPSKAIPFDAARTRLLKDNDGTPLLRYSISPIELLALPKRPGRRIRHYHEAVENQWRAYWENKGASVARAMRMRCEAKGETFSALFYHSELSKRRFALCLSRNDRGRR